MNRSTSRSNFTPALDRHEHRVLALMLIVLHITVWWASDSPMARALMMVHLGIFLLWQPLLSRSQRLDLRGLLVFAGIVVAFLAAMSWVLMTFWQLLLIALVSGRVNVSPRQRFVYLAAIVFLVLEFLIGSVPRMFSLDTPGRDFLELTGVAMLLVPSVIIVLPQAHPEQTRIATRAVDLLYGAALALITLTVGLGALVSTLATNVDYTVALIQTVLGLALLLLTLSWLWAPIAGFSGLGQLWERYVQNVGTPFEHWLGELERNAGEARSAQRFLKIALDQLLELPWVCGVSWELGDVSGQQGAPSDHSVSARSGDLHITLYAYRRMGTTLMLHARLLLRLVHQFFHARQREQALARQAHLQAIYETGARVTHDIKNLLQSLSATTAAVHRAGERGSADANALVARQLPLLRQRLQLALEKLQSPQAGDSRLCTAAQWWQGFTERNASAEIQFQQALEHDPIIPAELFDSVAENLLENARFKAQTEPGLNVTARVASNSNGVSLSVVDSGRAVPSTIAEALFEAAVSSASGLGIGLYQAAKQAEQHGYGLALADNQDGRVEFVLAPRADLVRDATMSNPDLDTAGRRAG